MEMEEALDVAIQVASALVAAHEAGIVHRDIKPENIMLRPDGYVKVLDFGIAKLAEEEAADGRTRRRLPFLETRLGSIFGTARYMSPEQARGEVVDKRTDIWSLGVVLYEMVTGQAPFRGENTEEVMTSILETEPPPLTGCPDELEQIVTRTLRKEPNERHANAPELIETLKKVRRRLELRAESEVLETTPTWRHGRRWAAALLLLLVTVTLALRFYWTASVRPKSPPPIKSIAVLPFENLSPEAENARLADGVQDEILTDLAKLADLKVISRSSVMPYRDKMGRNLREIGKELGVANLLEGSVQRSGNRVRVKAQLIDAQSDAHLWGQSFDGESADVFAIQSRIVRAIADRLQAELSASEKAAIAQPPTADLAAYALYQEALVLEHGSPEDQSLRQGIAVLEKAVARDPRFVLAYCALSRMHLDLYFSGHDPTPARRALAETALQNAVRIDPEAGEVHLAAARYWYHGFRDYDRARGELDSPGASCLTTPICISRSGSSTAGRAAGARPSGPCGTPWS